MKSLCRGGCSVPRSIGLVFAALFPFLIVQISAGSEPPTLSTPGPQTIFPGETISGIDFFIDDPDTPLELLTITVHSTNQEAVPDSHLTVTGVAPAKTLTIQTSPDHRGSTTIHIRVSDDTGNSVEKSFDVEVREFIATDLLLYPHRISAASWADFNRDGLLDIVIRHDETWTNETLILRGTSSVSSFDLIWSDNQSGEDDVFFAWSDLGNDGYLDLIETSDGGPGLLYRNQGGTLLAPITNGLPHLADSQVLWFDYDNDGDQDLFRSGLSTSEDSDGDLVVMLIQNSNGVLDEALPLPVSALPTSVDAGDFDNDGDLDLLICAINQAPSRILRNEGEGQFSAVDISLGSARFGGWVDLNNDGWLDIVLAGGLRLYENKGIDGFGPEIIRPADYPVGFVAGDLDNDGDTDLLVRVPWEGPTFQLIGFFRNDGDFSLTLYGYDFSAGPYEGVYEYPFVLPEGIQWTDLDNDGAPDILLGPEEGAVLYRSATHGINTPPQAPSSPHTIIRDNNLVELRWDRAQDIETPSVALKYNLRVGSAPGAIDVMSPNWNPETESLLIPGHHNAGQAPLWTLKDVPPGTYYWSVQAIDASGAASPFSQEGSFVIPNARPLISEIPDQTTAVNQPLEGVPFIIADEETLAADLVLTLTSSAPELVPVENLVVSGSGTNRTLRIVPTLDLAGETIVTLTVQDAYGHSRRIEFGVTVNLFTTTAQFPFDYHPFASPPDHALWADMDLNGTLELVTARTIRLIDTEGRVLSQLPLSDVRHNSYFDLGDFDGDGDLDATVAGPYFGPAVLRNILTPDQIQFEIAFETSGLQWWDIDNAGHLDLVANWRFQRNAEGKLFTTVNVPEMGGFNLDVGDYDADGDLDILTTGASIAIWRNDNRFQFADFGRDWLPQLNRNTGLWGDFNNDGRLDILLSGASKSEPSSFVDVTLLFIQKDDGSFATFPSDLPALTGAALGDYDNDGWLDLVLHSHESGKPTTMLYRNRDGEAFDRVKLPRLPVNGSALAWGDFDFDGDLDLFVGGVGDQSTRPPFGAILRNELNRPALVPPIPQNLHAAIETNLQNDVTFTWDAGPSGSAPPDLGVGFEFRVGTSPGGNEIMPAHAIWPDGKRTKPRLPTVHGRREWTLYDLKGGTYYWSVQAISQSLAGSPFAPEEVITLPNRIPTISTIPYQATTAGQSISNITFTVWDREGTDQLILSVTSSNPDLIDAADIELHGSGTNRTLTLNLQADRVGRAEITLTATDSDGAIAVTSFLLGVDELTQVPDTFSFLVKPAAEWGDFNNDGNLDLILAGATNNSAVTELYRGLGDGSFVESEIELPQVRNAVLRWTDLNRDGWLDLILNGTDPDDFRRTHVLVNLAGNGFDLIDHPFPDTDFTSFDVGDYDGDGDLDVVWSGIRIPVPGFPPGGVETWIFEQITDLRFFRTPTVLPQISEGNVSWVDIDSDGDPDLFLSGARFSPDLPPEPVTMILINDGLGQFSQAPFDLPPVSSPNALWQDMNQDGFPDLMLIGGGDHMLYQNDQGTNLVEHSRLLANIPGTQGAWGDNDSDGWSDYLVTGYLSLNRQSAVWVNSRGSGPWIPIPLLETNSYQGLALWGDWDNDFDLDLLLTGEIRGHGTGGISLYRNNIWTSVLPPDAPAHLASVVNGNRCVLSWSSSTDPWNSNRGDSFNLRVGTAPGLSDVVSSEADPTTGFRRVTRTGNRAHSTTATLRNLPPGTYYWSVQKINPAFAPSPFAPESSFVIDSQLPAVESIPDQFTLANQPTESIPLNISFPGGDPSLLIVEAFSDDTTLIPSEAFLWSAEGSNRSLVVAPASDQTGSAQVAIRATDPQGASSMTSFIITVGLFTDIAAELQGTDLTIISWADIDNDGDLDFLLSGTFFDRVHATMICKQTAPGIFEQVQMLYLRRSHAADWGDFDHDGDLDLLVTGALESAIFVNDGNGSFTPLSPSVPPILVGTAAWVDIDNDGDLDAFQSGSDRITVYRNEQGRFIETQMQLPPPDHGALSAWADYDNDGDPDLALGGLPSGSHTTRIYRNEGGLRFDNIGATPLYIPPGTPGSLEWGDYDQDGFPDLLVPGSDLDRPVTRIIRNEGHSSFVDSGIQLPELEFGVAFWIDFDGNGDLDLFLSGQSPEGRITDCYENLGTGVFTPAGLALPSLINGRAAAADYDGDGDLDLAIAGMDPEGRRRTMILQNHSLVLNTPPEVPDGLASSIIAHNSVHLTWNIPLDDRSTNPGSMSYNLVMGTSPDSIDVVTPNASLSNGFYRLAKPGNAGFTPFRTLKNLPNGTYHWRVQAIDSAFQGSAFSEPAMFVISNSLPSLAIPGNRTYAVNTGPHNIPLSGILPGFAIPETLSVLAWSDHPDLLPDPAVSYAPPNATGTLTLTPVPDQLGTARLFVVVSGTSDSEPPLSLATTNAFDVTIGAVPTTANIQVTTLEDTPVIIPLEATDADSENLLLMIVAPPAHGVVEGEFPNLVYRPDPDYFGSDRILYVASDGFFDSPRSIVDLTVVPVQDVEQVTFTMARMEDGEFLIELSGEPYAAYVLQWSEDLRYWTTRTDLSADSGGIIRFTERSINPNQRFYRLRLKD